jgi:hypothetical protein
MSVATLHRPVTRVFFSTAAAFAALIAGLMLAVLVFFTVIALFADYDERGVFLLWIPCVLWLGYFAWSAAAKDSWAGAAERVGFLLAATIAALVAGIYLVALILAAVGIGYSVFHHGASWLYLLLIPLLILFFLPAVAAVAWLAGRSRISRPWFLWFLVGTAAFSPAWVALYALSGGSRG